MAKFKGYAVVTLRVPVKFELDDEDADDWAAVLDGAAYAAEDAVDGSVGDVEEIDVGQIERCGADGKWAVVE